MKLYALSASIVTLAIAIAIGAFLYSTNLATGSVITGGEYDATHLTSAGTTTVRTLFGSIGQITVSSSSPAVNIGFYATTSQATSSDDLIFTFNASTDEGTYTYDVAFGGGLLVDVPTGYDGNIVLTTR